MGLAIKLFVILEIAIICDIEVRDLRITALQSQLELN